MSYGSGLHRRASGASKSDSSGFQMYAKGEIGLEIREMSPRSSVDGFNSVKLTPRLARPLLLDQLFAPGSKRLQQTAANDDCF